MKKRIKVQLIFLFLSVLFIFFLSNLSIIKAQNTPPMPDIPIIGGLVQNESSFTDTFEKFQANANALSEEESRKAYLKQEWTKILAENKAIAPVLYYTDKIFSFFNPLWNLVLKMPFSWSWMFILSFGIWIMLIFVFYITAVPFTQSNLFINFLIAFCVATLAGISGGINQGIQLLIMPLKNIWTVMIAIFIAICIVIIYRGIMKNIGKGIREKGKKDRGILRESKESAHEKIIDTKLRAEGM
ncbi:MAG: hypothetical protein AABX54_03510 [Nanoarchaeota archaeon]